MNKASQYGASHYAFKKAQKNNMEKLTQWVTKYTIESKGCNECKGTGEGGFLSGYCKSCSGSGFIPTVKCPKCGGEGKGIILKCGLCNGIGQTSDWKALRNFFNVI